MRQANLIAINANLIIFSNNKTNQAIINKIAAGIDPLKFKALPVYKTKQGYILTDGNHRAKAAIQAGYTHLPCILLTKPEYDYVKYHKTHTVDIQVIPPKHYKTIKTIDTL